MNTQERIKEIKDAAMALSATCANLRYDLGRELNASEIETSKEAEMTMRVQPLVDKVVLEFYKNK